MAGAELIGYYFQNMQELLSHLDVKRIDDISRELIRAMQTAKRIFVFGNGGCSAHASHFCADLGKMMKLERNETYRILSLNDNMPSVTAWANDTGYENIFWRQLELHALPGDIAFAMSGSGNSLNVIRAIEYASAHKITTIGLCGFGGGKMAKLVDHGYVVPSDNMQLVEDAFGIILHAIFVALRDRQE
ncbi:SIS domain-containing protein [candidate division KSB1 bacterium]|nr:SIS domain-containing protein [candidate division KSB1 bacterium]